MGQMEDRIKHLRNQRERGWENSLTVDERIILDLAGERDVLTDAVVEAKGKLETEDKRTVASLCAADVGKKVRFSGDTVSFVGHVVSFEVPEPYERLTGCMASSADRINITLRRISAVGVIEHPIIMELTDTMEVTMELKNTIEVE